MPKRCWESIYKGCNRRLDSLAARAHARPWLDKLLQYPWLILLTLLTGPGQWLIECLFGGLKTPAAPGGIVSLELARDSGTARAILASWGDGRTAVAWWCIGLDFFFICFYVALLVRLCRWARRTLPGNAQGDGSLAQQIGGPIALGVFVAGITDVIENVAMLILLSRGATGDLHWPTKICSWAAIVKFTLLVFAVAYILVAARLHPTTRGALRVAHKARFSFYVTLIAAAIYLIPQGQDGLRLIAENANSGQPANYWAFFAAAFIFDWLSWYGARGVLLKIIADNEGEAGDGGMRKLARIDDIGYVKDAQTQEKYDRGVDLGVEWVPRIYAGLPSFLFAIAAMLALPPTVDGRGWLLGLIIYLLMLTVLLPLLLTLRRGKIDKGKNRKKHPTTPNAEKDTFGEGVLKFFGPDYAWGGVGIEGGSPRLRTFAAVLPLLWGGLLWLLTSGLLEWLSGTAPVVFGWLPTASGVAIKMGSAAVVAAGLSFIIPLGSYLVYASEKTRFPFLTVLTALVLAFALLDLGDNHRMRRLTPKHPGHVPARPALPLKVEDDTPTPEAGLRLAPKPLEVMKPSVGNLVTAFHDWLARRKGGTEENPYPVIFVACEGGGMRAAYQASHVMSAIQQRHPEFARHVFLISGVSGGSMGAAVFAGMTRLHDQNAGNNIYRQGAIKDREGGLENWVDVSNQILADDMLAPPMAGLLSADFVQRFLPITIGSDEGSWFDRAYLLETALEQAFFREAMTLEERKDPGNNLMTRSFYEPFRIGSNQWLDEETPVLYFNAANVEKGDRMVAASLLPNAGAWSKPDDDPLDARSNDGMRDVSPGINGLRCLASVAPEYDIRLSTAAVMSARFPLFAPSAMLPVQQTINQPPASRRGDVMLSPDTLDAPALVKQRFVDGGYFENSGVTTINDVLQLLDDNRANAEMPWEARVLIIRFKGDAVAIPEDLGSGIPYPILPRRSSGIFDWPIGFAHAALAHGDIARARLSKRLKEQKFSGKAKEQNSFGKAYEVAFVQEKRNPLPTNFLLSARGRFEIQYQTGLDFSKEWTKKEAPRDKEAAELGADGQSSPAHRQRTENQTAIQKLTIGL